MPARRGAPYSPARNTVHNPGGSAQAWLNESDDSAADAAFRLRGNLSAQVGDWLAVRCFSPSKTR